MILSEILSGRKKYEEMRLTDWEEILYAGICANVGYWVVGGGFVESRRLTFRLK
jgi:hypothetical protein